MKSEKHTFPIFKSQNPVWRVKWKRWNNIYIYVNRHIFEKVEYMVAQYDFRINAIMVLRTVYNVHYIYLLKALSVK